MERGEIATVMADDRQRNHPRSYEERMEAIFEAFEKGKRTTERTRTRREHEENCKEPPESPEKTGETEKTRKKVDKATSFVGVDRRFVQKPTRMVTEERDLRKDENLDHGSADAIISACFPTRHSKTYCPWRERVWHAPLQFLDLDGIQQRHQRTVIPDHPPTPPSSSREACRRRREQAECLESLHETLRLIHGVRTDDASLEFAYKQWQRAQYNEFDDDDDDRSARPPLRVTETSRLSWIFGAKLGDFEFCAVPRQRKNQITRLRPVFIDGLNFLSNFRPDLTPPHITVKCLLQIVFNFILEGHKTCIYLPDFYLENTSEKVDDTRAFEFLVSQKIINFSEKRNRKSFESDVREAAEKVNGILVTTDELERKNGEKSIIACPVIDRYTKFGDQFLIAIDFSANFGENCQFPRDFIDSSSSESELSDSAQEVAKIRHKNHRSHKTYSPRENVQIDTDSQQLTLKTQVFLISALLHFAAFHLLPLRRARVILTAIQRDFPQNLPDFMRKTAIEDVAEALRVLRDGENLDRWPIVMNFD